MRRPATMLLLLLVLGSVAGCFVSSQIGERRYYASPDPETITFHFDTTLNRVTLFGRSGLLALAPWLLFAGRARGSDWVLPAVVAAAGIVLAAWLLVVGWGRVFDYRIEVGPAALELRLPPHPQLVIPWQAIEGIDVTGPSRDVRLLDSRSHPIKWATEWRDMKVYLASGRTFDVDLRPLSPEQRGTLWRAIRRKANLGEEVEVPAPTR